MRILQGLHRRLLSMKYRLARRLPSARKREAGLDMAGYVDLYGQIWREAAERISGEFHELARGVWEVRYQGRSTLIHNYRVQLDDPVILNVAGHKPLCYRLMAEAGLPVPEHEVFTLDAADKAGRFMDKYPGAGFVVKPAAGTAASRGVTTHVQTFRECYRAGVLASLFNPEILIERLVPGESYRLLVLNGKVIHASRRRGVHVRWDGRSTVRQLVEEKGGFGSGIRTDRDYRATLRAGGLTEDSVPAAGQEVLVKSFPRPLNQGVEVCTFYDEDVTDLICQDLREKAVQASRILRAEFAGVDILSVDPTLPLGENNGVINEVNTTPGLHHHYRLRHAGDTPPAVLVLKHLLGMA